MKPQTIEPLNFTYLAALILFSVKERLIFFYISI